MAGAHSAALPRALLILSSALLAAAVRAAPAASSPCTGPLGPEEVVRCALAQSLDLRLARQELAVLAGRRVTAGTWLPSHPVASLALAERRLFSGVVRDEGTGPLLNWYVTLSQELEIAGQRGARLDVADAAAAAQVRRVAVGEQEAAAAALSAYYDLLAAEEELQLAADLGQIGQSLSALAAARSRGALLSPVDADVAQAEGTRLGRARFEAGRRRAAARAAFVLLLGLPDAPALSGSLEQIPPGPEGTEAEELVRRALTLRGEMAAAEMERRMRVARVGLLRRERIPNLTLSFTAQRDGFDERVLGGGLSLPLFLPGPIGPSRGGEIQSAQAEAVQAELTAERVRRQVRGEVARALAGEEAYGAELLLYPPELIGRARADLQAVAQALASRQVPLRDALLSQRSLVELLQNHLQARLGRALARVELRRASGLSLSGGRP